MPTLPTDAILMVMKLPSITSKKPLGTNDYLTQQDPNAKKKLYFMIGGVVVLLLLIVLLFSGKSTPAGQASMKKGIQASSEALGVINKYGDGVKQSMNQNDVSLTSSLLQSNFKDLNSIYSKTYKPKKKLSSSPTLDAKSKATLDAAIRDNTLDTDIIIVLQAKVQTAETSLRATKPYITSKQSADKIQSAINDLDSIQDTLSRAR